MYYDRVVDQDLKERLEYSGAVLIIGPKWCGKTTTAEMQSESILRMQDPDYSAGYIATAGTKPSILLKGETPRLIDEWQVAPVLWDAVRTAVDSRSKSGQFILTGSTSVDNTQIMHSGTGRISRMKMYPMSLFESKESSGEISLKEMFHNTEYEIDGIKSDLTIEELIFAACRGGWPQAVVTQNKKYALRIADDYVANICEADISSVDGVKRNPTRTRAILKSYARNISTPAKKSSMIKDMKAEAEEMAVSTFDDYANALKKLFVIEDVTAWCPSVRSATAIRSGHKREFIDPSIAVAVLGLSPESLELDMKTFGFIFECLCIRDLKIYSSALGGEISYYRDRYGLETDAVLHLADGRYALIEFKLGSVEIEEGAEHLKELRDLIIEHNKTETQVPLREPDLLVVITGGNMAYTREDGVKVVPIGCMSV